MAFSLLEQEKLQKDLKDNTISISKVGEKSRKLLLVSYNSLLLFPDMAELNASDWVLDLHCRPSWNTTEWPGTWLQWFETLLGTLHVAVARSLTLKLCGCFFFTLIFFSSLCCIYTLTTQLNKGKPGPGL